MQLHRGTIGLNVDLGLHQLLELYMGLNARKPVFMGLQTTKAQTSLYSLISALVIRLLESIIYTLATSEILIF